MRTFNEHILDIAEDRTHGSNELLSRTISAFIDHKEQLDQDQLTWAFEQLEQMDAAMATIQHFRRSLQGKIETEFWQALEDYRQQWARVDEEICANFDTKFKLQNSRVLTHSNSSTVQRLFQTSKAERVKVFQTKSFPGAEGLMQADRLSGEGMDVELVKDTSIDEVIQGIDLCVLGCDQFTPSGFLNKMGTSTIVGLAIDHGVPAVVLADSRKEVQQLTEWGNLFECTDFSPGMFLITESRITTC